MNKIEKIWFVTMLIITLPIYLVEEFIYNRKRKHDDSNSIAEDRIESRWW